MKTIKTLDELKNLADGRVVFIRYSRSHAEDIKRGYSLDHSTMAREPGLSVQEIRPEDWDESPGWVVRLVADYGSRMRSDSESYGWVATGTIAGRDADGCPAITDVTCIGILDRGFVIRCLDYSRDYDKRRRAPMTDRSPWPRTEDYGI